jgi:small-conductance mechanosensitive channel
MKEPPPTIRLREFGDSGIVFELLVWTSTQTHRRGLFSSNINFGIIRKFSANNIVIPFPQRDLHLKSNFDAGNSEKKD